MAKNCVICGKPSGMYPLCKEHLKMKNLGAVAKCDKCDNWYVVADGCKCSKRPNDTSTLTCIICGKNSNGKHFCLDCYNKYKDRTIDLKIKNCVEYKLLDPYGNKDTKTANGLYVRSLSEKIIYDEIFSRGIKCEYERTVSYKNEKGEIKELHPDFYLTDYKLYIEHWGMLETRNKQYIKEKEFKEKIYKAKGYKLAATVNSDIKDIQTAIDRILLENDIEI